MFGRGSFCLSSKRWRRFFQHFLQTGFQKGVERDEEAPSQSFSFSHFVVRIRFSLVETFALLPAVAFTNVHPTPSTTHTNQLNQGGLLLRAWQVYEQACFLDLSPSPLGWLSSTADDKCTRFTSLYQRVAFLYATSPAAPVCAREPVEGGIVLFFINFAHRRILRRDSGGELRTRVV